MFLTRAKLQAAARQAWADQLAFEITHKEKYDADQRKLAVTQRVFRVLGRDVTKELSKCQDLLACPKP
jgi:hypothetical protein